MSPTGSVSLVEHQLIEILIPKVECYYNKYLKVWMWLQNVDIDRGLKNFDDHDRKKKKTKPLGALGGSVF